MLNKFVTFKMLPTHLPIETLEKKPSKTCGVSFMQSYATFYISVYHVSKIVLDLKK